MKINLETLTKWSEPKRVQTARGERLLQTGPATDAFWTAWRAAKDDLKTAGISCARDQRSGGWQAAWWQPVPAATLQAEVAAIETSRAASAEVELVKPFGLDYMPFQKAGIQFALGRPNTLIADEMGLGKTIQALGVINNDETIKRVLVVCPASLKLNWKREAEKWLVRPLTVGIADSKTGVPHSDVVIVNYDILKKLQPALAAMNFDLLIADEVHYCKNAKALRSKAFYALTAPRKIFLTGTPILNRPVELQPIVGALDKDQFGNFFQFAKRYANAHHNGYGWDFSGASYLGELQEKLRRSIMIRRLKADVLTDLPAKRRQVIELAANGASAAIKRETVAFARHEARLVELRALAELAKADSEAAYTNAIAELKQCARVAFDEISRLRHETALAKLPYVVEHIKSFTDEGASKVVVFAHHKDVIEKLAAEFGASCVTLTGDTALNARQAAVDRFQTDATCQVFIGSIRAAGVGLTLTASAHVIFAELDWTPGQMTQCEDRTHRIGQTNNVLIQHLVLEGSIDARMAKTLVDKQAIADAALDNETEKEIHANDIATGVDENAATKRLTVISVAKLAQAEEITVARREELHAQLRHLAAVCDGAQERDGHGFNKIDACIGQSLAEQTFLLTPKQAVLAERLCRKYRRQLN